MVDSERMLSLFALLTEVEGRATIGTNSPSGGCRCAEAASESGNLRLTRTQLQMYNS